MSFGGDLCLVFMMFLIFGCIAIPLTIVFWAISFPCKLIRCCTRKKIESKIEVHENTSPDAPIDDLLFIHGWPDCGDVWSNQIKAFSSEYNCI